jgi:hypothetical protein
VLDFGQVLVVTVVAAGASIIGGLVATISGYFIQRNLQSTRLADEKEARQKEREQARLDAVQDRVSLQAAVAAERERASTDVTRATQRARLEPVIRNCVPVEEALSAGYDEAPAAEEAGRNLWVACAAELYLAAGTAKLRSAIRDARDRCRAYATAAAITEDLRRKAIRSDSSPSTLQVLQAARVNTEKSRVAAQRHVVSVRRATLKLVERNEGLVPGAESTPSEALTPAPALAPK